MSIYSDTAPVSPDFWGHDNPPPWVVKPTDWRARALCSRMVAEAYPDDRQYVANTWWPISIYHSAGRGHDRRPSPEALEAVELCKQCPVRSECAEAGLAEPDGVWGALLPHERQALKQRREAVSA